MCKSPWVNGWIIVFLSCYYSILLRQWNAGSLIITAHKKYMNLFALFTFVKYIIWWESVSKEFMVSMAVKARQLGFFYNTLYHKIFSVNKYNKSC